MYLKIMLAERVYALWALLSLREGLLKEAAVICSGSL